tara:strand:+ start:811 stop:1053 length:243 start_codon:yes stop_codon:yes gene_type:complete
MKHTLKLPQSQQDIVAKALKVYQTSLETLGDEISNNIDYAVFDIYSLIGIFKDTDIELRVELDEETLESFIKHGVDFPEY